jgi:hypothetical protein
MSTVQKNAPRKRSSVAVSGAIADVSKAKKTKGARAAAFGHFEVYQAEKDEDLHEELQDPDLDTVTKGELVIKRLVSFASWLTQNPVLQMNSTEKCLGIKSIQQYFGSVKEEIKEQTSELAIWENHEEEWYSQLRSNLGSGKKRTQLDGEDDFKDPSSRALPIRCEASKLRQKERHWLQLQGVDLESICSSIIKNCSNDNNAYQNRCKLVLTALAVGRGGEVKFLRWDEFWWDDLFLSTEGVWTRMKTLTQHILYFQCDCIGYICDFYHSLGCYFSVEDGLYRIDHGNKKGNKKNTRANKFVFPDLRIVSNESVARMMTKLIRKHSHQQFQQLNQSRGIRVGSNTELAMHPEITPEEQRLAGGFSAGNNSELYTRMNPNLGMPAANALAGHPKPRGRVYPPSLDRLVSVSAETLDLLMARLYLISVPQFKEGGQLRPILRTCTASLIMHHQQMCSQFGTGNKVVQKLIDSVVKAKIEGTASEASKTLDHWSTIIQQDYETNNGLIPNLTDVTVLSAVQAQTVVINDLLLQYQRREVENELLTNEVASLRIALETQSGNIISGVSSAVTSALKAITPSRARELPITEHPVVKRPSLAVSVPGYVVSTTNRPSLAGIALVDGVSGETAVSEVSNVNDTSIPSAVRVFVNQMKAIVSSAEAEGKKDTLAQLCWRDDRLGNDSNKGLMVRDMLFDLVKEGKLHADHKLYEVEPLSLSRKNRGFYWAVMELVECVLTPEQELLIRLGKKEQNSIVDYDDVLKVAIYTIEDQAFKKMQVLDGKTGTQCRKTLTGMGGRYKKYCEDNNVERKKTSDSAMRGPPQQGKSILSYFGNMLSPSKKQKK